MFIISAIFALCRLARCSKILQLGFRRCWRTCYGNTCSGGRAASMLVIHSLISVFFYHMQVRFCFIAMYVTFLFVPQFRKYFGNRWTYFCAKFTEKTCLDPRSDEFERQAQKSKVKITRDGFPAHWQCIVRGRVRPTLQMTSTSSRRNHSVASGGDRVTTVHADGGLRAVYVW